MKNLSKHKSKIEIKVAGSKVKRTIWRYESKYYIQISSASMYPTVINGKEYIEVRSFTMNGKEYWYIK